jgi:hypothetical protein
MLSASDSKIEKIFGLGDCCRAETGIQTFIVETQLIIMIKRKKTTV